MKFRISIVAIVSFAACFFAHDAFGDETIGVDEPVKPNIVLINVDDLGWADLACQGSKYYQTPNVDRLASEGMRFTNAYASASNCAPSRACLMSGQQTPRHGIYTVANSDRGKSNHRKLIPTPNTITLADSIITIAEVLQAAGYATASLGKWHLGKDPTTQGFDLNVAGNKKGNPGKSPTASEMIQTALANFKK